MKHSVSRIFNILVGLALMLALQGNAISAKAAGNILYVTPTGSDTNACTDPLFPCATIQAAVDKAANEDLIKVSIGTYTGGNADVVNITKNLSLSGGWDTSFSSRIGSSIIDGQNARIEIRTASGTIVSLEYFTLQNGKGGLYNYGNITVSNTIVSNNIGEPYCWGGGITNLGTMTIQQSDIHGNTCEYGGFGGGIYNWQYGGSLIVINSSIHDNQTPVAGGIYTISRPITIINSTITNNTKGGIYIDSAIAVIKNSTIAFNNGGTNGGGIYFTNNFGGSVTLQNTIVSNNTADYASDCYGPITSTGYNIISDSALCNFTATTGDLLDVDPRLGPLQNNGGATPTNWLYQGSPAIDGGNPSGCTDHLGNPLTTDQRGSSRPLDGNNDGNNVCDIGAYEADPANLPPVPPTHNLYVKIGGSNSNSCLTPDAACATINGAINKSQSGDTIFVASGTYTNASGAEVVFINKNITLSGGWNPTFVIQSGISVVDGQVARRGIKVDQEIKTRIELFMVQNGFVMDSDTVTGYPDGGGIYIDWRGKVTLVNSIIHNNQVGNYISPYVQGNGGGVAMSTVGSLTAYNSTFSGNSAIGFGGGIYNDRSIVTLINCNVTNNSAEKGGGGIAGGDTGQIILKNSAVSNNSIFALSDGRGGGIYTNTSSLTVINSTIDNNISTGEGGGIYSYSMNIENSSISGNQADLGGGIYQYWTSTIINSSIHDNQSLYAGGGIFTVHDLFLINTTIANNSVSNPYSLTTANGGGIYKEGGYPLYASNVTIARNTADNYGGGIWTASGGIVLQNTIIGENVSLNRSDCSGAINSGGYNLISNTVGCDITPGEGDLLNMPASLAFLVGWPGAMAPLPFSSAIDNGNPTGCKDHNNYLLSSDQLGTIRPLDGNNDGLAYCDIGAYEYDSTHSLIMLYLPITIK